MRILRIYLLLVLPLLIISEDVFAQKSPGRRNSGRNAFYKMSSRKHSNFTSTQRFRRDQRYISVGAGLGIANYFGDLAPVNRNGSTELSLTRGNYSIFAQKRLNYNMQARVQYSLITLRGSDLRSTEGTSTQEFSESQQEASTTGRRIRNLHFRNNVSELAASIIFEFEQTTGNILRRKPFIPYAHLGFALLYHNPQGYNQFSGSWESLRQYETEGESYLPIAFAIPFGLGARLRVADRVDLGLEFTYRVTFTDKLDDISGSYPDSATISQMTQEEFYMSNPSVLAGNGPDETRDEIPVSGAPTFTAAELEAGVANTLISGDDPSTTNVIETTISGISAYQLSDGSYVLYATGQNEGSSPRGTDANDHYFSIMVTGTYILGHRARRKPKFR